MKINRKRVALVLCIPTGVYPQHSAPRAAANLPIVSSAGPVQHRFRMDPLVPGWISRNPGPLIGGLALKLLSKIGSERGGRRSYCADSRCNGVSIIFRDPGSMCTSLSCNACSLMVIATTMGEVRRMSAARCELIESQRPFLAFDTATSPADRLSIANYHSRRHEAEEARRYYRDDKHGHSPTGWVIDNDCKTDHHRCERTARGNGRRGYFVTN